MKSVFTRAMGLWALLLSSAVPTAVSYRAVKIARTDPLGQVFALLDDLAAKITKEGEKEATAYKAFVEWCDDASSNKGFEIKTFTANKEKLEALIIKTSNSAASAADKIEELAASIAGDEADLKSATTIREKEVSEFSTNEAELGDVVDTLGRAIAIVEREMAKNPAAFAQVDTSKIDKLLGSLGAVVEAAGFSAVDRKKLLAMVQSQQGDDADSDELGAPAAAVYKSHSANIVDVLEDLKEKAEEQLAGLRKAETSAKHNYEMLKQSLEDQISADSKDLQEQKDGKAASEQAKAVAEGDLAMTAKGLVDAKGALELCHSNCLTTAADHEATVAARTAELKVLAEAKALLQSSTPGAAGHVYSFLEEEQQHTQAGTVQVGSSLRTRTDLVNAEVVHMVKELAKKHHSQALNQLASRIAAVVRFGTSAGEDPFTKVKALVEELISKLESEASSEAGEKDYCDEQMSKTEAKKGELEHDISKLTAKIDQAVAQSSSLKGAVKDAQAELATLAKEQAEMDKMRSEGHAAYVEAKAVLEDGLEGVRKALGVLRDYYGGDAAAAALQESSSAAGGSFLQQPVVPEIHEKAQGAGSSIMGILEVVESDIAKSLAAEEAQETDAEVEYEKVTQENAIAKTLKDQSVKYNTQEFKSLDKSVADLSGDRETTNTELSAVVEYYAKIKERCIAKPEAYEERKQRREAEIAGLKEALQVLEEETAFVQRRHRNRSPFLRGFDGRL